MATDTPQIPERTLGLQVAAWIEDGNLVYGPGDVIGEPYRLTTEQIRFLCRAYELDEHGRRVIRRAVLSRRKGTAKTEFAAAVTAAELCGPVRFDGWDAYGEPVGAPVRSASIPIAATSEDQAEETLYGAFRVMVEPLATAGLLDVGLERTHGPLGGKAQLVSSSSVARDGARPTFTPCEETHLWRGRELGGLHATLSRNLAKRRDADPWMLEVTTAYAPGEMSVAELTHDYARRVASGEITDAGLLFDHLAADARHDIDTEEGLLAAIREASGMAWSFTNLAAILAQFRDPQVERADFRRYWLNQVVATVSQWLTPDEWAELAAPLDQDPVAAGDLIALGFDGSKFHDATALIGCRISDGHLFTIATWEKPTTPGEADGWEVPSEEVNAAVDDAFGTYRVVRFYADPPFWQTEVDAWARKWGAMVVEWWTNRDVQMARAVERMHTAARSRGFTHDRDPVLGRHVANARRRNVRSGYVLTKRAKGAPEKIDAAVAAVLAYEARCDAVAAGTGRQKSKAMRTF